jgi:DNA-binding transcriptional ArsR family regulator
VNEHPFEQLAALDRMVHEPARLAILTVLSACKSADFVFLQRTTGLSKGNLSSHLTKLEESGLVAIAKAFAGKVPKTTVTLTDVGRVQVETHWKELDRIRTEASRWTPDEAPAK